MMSEALQASSRFSLRVSVVSRRSDGKILIEVDGDLDLLTAPYLLGSLMRAVNDRLEPKVLLDLSQVSFIDAAGWCPVAEAGAALSERGEALEIVSASPRVWRLLEIIDTCPGVELAGADSDTAMDRFSGPPEEVSGCYYLG